MNNAMFEEKWKVIRAQSPAWWGLMTERDLSKVDDADPKFEKFATLLQVKYGYTRQKAREEVRKAWAKYQGSRKNAAA